MKNNYYSFGQLVRLFSGQKNVFAFIAFIMAGNLFSRADAQLIVYEPFDYEYASSAPDPDGGANGNNGFPFTNEDKSKTGVGLRTHWGADMTVIDGLSYGNSKGDSLLVKANALNSNANGGSGFGAQMVTLYRNVENDPFFSFRAQLDENYFGWNPFVGKKELYFSFLAKVDTVNTIDATVNNTNKRTGLVLKVAHNNTDNTTGIGQYNSKWYYYHQGGFSFVLADAVAEKTEFIVGKYTFGSLDEFKVDIWFNPALGETLPATPSCTVTIPTAGQFRGFQGRYGAGNFTFDEIRMGVTAADVMPLAAAPNAVRLTQLYDLCKVFQSDRNQLTIVSNDNNLKQSGVLEVFDVRGNSIFKSANLNDQQVITTSSNGLYIVKVTSGTNYQVQKVLMK